MVLVAETQEYPRNEKGALLGFQGLTREPRHLQRGNKGILWVPAAFQSLGAVETGGLFRGTACRGGVGGGGGGLRALAVQLLHMTICSYIYIYIYAYIYIYIYINMLIVLFLFCCEISLILIKLGRGGGFRRG